MNGIEILNEPKFDECDFERMADGFKRFVKVAGYFKYGKNTPVYVRVVMNIDANKKIRAADAADIIKRMKARIVEGANVTPDQVQSITRDQYEKEVGEPEQ